MKIANFNKSLIAIIVLATAPYASASILSSSEIKTVRGVLRALSIDETQLSDEEIEVLRNQGNEIRSYEESKSEFLQKVSDGLIYRTCGAGSHGGGNDPV